MKASRPSAKRAAKYAVSANGVSPKLPDRPSQERVLNLTCVRKLLGGVDKAVVEITDQKKLLQEICRIAVQKAGLRLAWTGIVNKNGRVEPVAKFGPVDYVRRLSINVYGRDKNGPAALALRTDSAVVVEDIDHDPRMALWHAKAKKFGLHYLAAFPLRFTDEVQGGLFLYAQKPDFFGAEEVSLLTLLSQKISYALTAIHLREKNERSFYALQQSEKDLTEFIDQSPIGIMSICPKGHIEKINRAGLKLLGRKKSAVLHAQIQKFSQDHRLLARGMAQLLCGGTMKEIRARFSRHDGRLRHVVINANGEWINGKLKQSRWFLNDVTHRIRLEKEVLTITEQIGQHLGQELHDDLGQQLSSIEFLSHGLARKLAGLSKRDAAAANKIARLVRQSIKKTRRIAHDLLPVVIDNIGLRNALQDFARNIERTLKIECKFQCGDRLAKFFAPDQGMHLYRIAQEAVNNAIKHARAQRIEIHLFQKENRVQMVVKNNGLPLPRYSEQGSGVGLRLMTYRAASINGTLNIQQDGGGMTAVTCSVPTISPDFAGQGAL